MAAQSAARTNVEMTCYRCQCHSVRECERKRVYMRCYWCNQEGHISRDCSGNEARDISFFRKYLDEILPVSYVYVNRLLHLVLLDSGSFRRIVSKGLYSTWRRKSWWPQYTARLRCVVAMGWLESLQRPETLLNWMHKKSLDFDLLLGYNAIKLLDSVNIMCLGDMQFQETTSVYVALKIDQPNFSVEFDQHQKACTASWKWMEDKEPPQLQNHMTEYKYQAHIWVGASCLYRAWQVDYIPRTQTRSL